MTSDLEWTQSDEMDESYPEDDFTTVRSVWEALYEGKKIELLFPSENEMRKFRTRLQQIKAKTEHHLISIGFMAESEIEQLSFKRLSKEESKFLVFLAPKPSSRFVFLAKVVDQ